VEFWPLFMPRPCRRITFGSPIGITTAEPKTTFGTRRSDLSPSCMSENNTRPSLAAEPGPSPPLTIRGPGAIVRMRIRTLGWMAI
jgi:hypothetical protein